MQCVNPKAYRGSDGPCRMPGGDHKIVRLFPTSLIAVVRLKVEVPPGMAMRIVQAEREEPIGRPRWDPI